MSKYAKKFQFSSGTAPVLLVIDMQTNFTTDQELIAIVESEIAEAVALEHPVVLVQYRWCGEIHQALSSAAGLSDHNQLQFPVTKSDDNGASEILGTCRRLGIKLDHIRVCGVNTNACVEDTVLEMSSQLPNSLIEVLGYACRNEKTANDYRAFARRNVRVIKDLPQYAAAA